MGDWEESSGFWWSQCPPLFLSIVSVLHCINIISDLCTNSRRSLSHRESLPEITFEYRLLSWFSLFSVALFTIELWLDWITILRGFPSLFYKPILMSLADLYFSATLYVSCVFVEIEYGVQVIVICIQNKVFNHCSSHYYHYYINSKYNPPIDLSRNSICVQ
eukprot:97589_1